ncbi:hypothetical protein CBR_g48187 [Chara braunii]|uniref:HAT C-terminal dimerisation domain-containing protein n=1 Tax=Chara braunii TaxID=69332 RepID=A0A388M293_CHABU|nr:hypothetical protein CBR_g48187 [Chara braunii]|eukprot:GBG88656.1 hypothetical protein CBR_g48187 [Chara braunii]
MLKCLFYGHEFQGNQYMAARHFRQGKGCPSVTDKALVDINYNSNYKLEGKILDRMLQFEELHGPTPVMDPRRDEGGAGGAGQERGDEEVVDVDNVEDEGCARVGSQAHVDVEDAAAAVGKRKEREEAARPGGQKRLRQNTIMESYSSKWQMEFKNKFLRFVYSQHLLFNVFRSEPWKELVKHFKDLPGPVKVLWSSHNEIANMETFVRTADDVAGDLAEVRAPFYVTGATIMSDGRKSRDVRPIVIFLAGGLRGVMMVQTMNREGERDQAADVLAHWIKVFNEFPPRWVNAICVDSASEYVTATNMLQGAPTKAKDSTDHVAVVRSACPQQNVGPGGLHMSQVVHWTQDVTRDVACEVHALPSGVAHFIMQKVQVRCAHMLEPAHAAAHLLCPSRRDLRYYEGIVSDYDARLVRKAETYIITQTWFSVTSPNYEAAYAQQRDFHTRRGGIVWGRRDGDKEAQRCTDDVETFEASCWWSKWGQCVPQLQAIALRVMYMWTCSSPAERNWAVHEAVHTMKRNKLDFEKVAKLVEISANARLLSHQRVGRDFALSWTVDESMLDVEGSIGTRPSWQGTDATRLQEDRERQRRSWTRDPCGSRAPLGEVGEVFGNGLPRCAPTPEMATVMTRAQRGGGSGRDLLTIRPRKRPMSEVTQRTSVDVAAGASFSVEVTRALLSESGPRLRGPIPSIRRRCTDLRVLGELSQLAVAAFLGSIPDVFAVGWLHPALFPLRRGIFIEVRPPEGNCIDL